jgi:hypothetical protein
MVKVATDKISEVPSGGSLRGSIRGVVWYRAMCGVMRYWVQSEAVAEPGTVGLTYPLAFTQVAGRDRAAVEPGGDGVGVEQVASARCGGSREVRMSAEPVGYSRPLYAGVLGDLRPVDFSFVVHRRVS